MDRFIGILSKSFMAVGGAALFVLVLLATGNVTMRFFHAPYAGTYELVSFLGALVTAGALAHTQRRKDHIVVDILSEKFPPVVKRVLDAVNYAVTCALFAVISWQVWVWGDKIRTGGELSETLKIDYYPFVYGVSVGFGLLAVVLFVDFLKSLAHPEHPEVHQ
ncbi:TRAP transporter small permease [Geomonas sp. RF6]|uniref:TRAP transporter small permease n=1 Tax=Geomonas sp. RF6 TaxID=2897342 RepID=UPI001E39E2BB|nr:TRAP transporter small permease [Geomonas sp. RF6]UFS70858.1 TRAP transporter small permease [Geomonas sp. RF6]